MENDMRKRIRQIILEVMADGKVYTIFEFKESIHQKTGYVYKIDYTESQLSGAIKYLHSKGRILRSDRGSYILATASNPQTAGVVEDSLSEQATVSEQYASQVSGQEPHLESNLPLSLKKLALEMRYRLQADYVFILQAMKNVDLSSSEDEDIQIFHKLLRLRDAIQKVME